MLIDIQEQIGSIVFTIDGEVVEFTAEDLNSIGIDLDKAKMILNTGN